MDSIIDRVIVQNYVRLRELKWLYAMYREPLHYVPENNLSVIIQIIIVPITFEIKNDVFQLGEKCYKTYNIWNIR